MSYINLVNFQIKTVSIQLDTVLQHVAILIFLFIFPRAVATLES